ncbi:MAG: amidohydrolase family protein [Planctomycetota bacterium]
MRARTLPLVAAATLSLLAASLRTPLLAQERADQPVVVAVGRLHVGDGKVLEDVRVRIEDGKLAAIDPDEGPVPAGVRFVDLRRKTMIPGLVAAAASFGARDSELNLTPDRVAADDFDLYAKQERLLRSGLTTVALVPGEARLMPGQVSVVKLAGEDPARRILSTSSALQVNLEPRSRQVPAVFEPNPVPTDEDPLLPSRRQRGSSRASQIAVLKAAFEEAREAPEGALGGEGPTESRYDLGCLKQALASSLPVRLRAQDAGDLLHGLRLCDELGVRVVLDRPEQAPRLVDRLGRRGIPVVLAVPLRPATPEPGDWSQDEAEDPGLAPDHAAILARAGLPVALVPQSDADLDKLRHVAGAAARYGLPADKALAGITLEAARVLGVDSRVGSLAPGKDADFVILSGAPFDARTRVEEVWVDGRLVHESDVEVQSFALKVGRLLTGDGKDLRDATVVVEDGRVVAAGPWVEAPRGIDVLEFPDAVLVPGFIAPATKLGLHADQGTAIAAGPEVDVATFLDPRDPAFAEALASGVTSLLVTPDSGTPVGARIAAVKTGGREKGFVTRPVAGLRMRAQAGGAQGVAQLVAEIEKARKYVNPPEEKPKEEAKKDEPKPDEKKDAKAGPVDLSGDWTATAEVRSRGQSRTVQIPIEIKQNGTDLDLSVRLPGMPVAFAGKGKVEGDKVTGELQGQIGPMALKMKFEGTYADEKITGALTLTTPRGQQRIEFTAARGKAGPARPTAKAADKKEPAKDEKLEPFRAVFDQGAPLVVTCANRDAVLAAVEAVVTKSKLPLVVQAPARPLVEEPVTLPKGANVGFLLQVSQASYEDEGKTVDVASALAAQGFEVLLYAGVQRGTALLPLHVAWTVSEGFDTRRAMASLTAGAARCYGLEERIGRIAEGCDADFVLFSGDPFDLTSTVRKVWVSGRLCVDHDGATRPSER